MGIEPTPPQLRCDALLFELLSPWEQGGGERGSFKLVYENSRIRIQVRIPGSVYKCHRFDIYDEVHAR